MRWFNGILIVVLFGLIGYGTVTMYEWSKQKGHEQAENRLAAADSTALCYSGAHLYQYSGPAKFARVPSPQYRHVWTPWEYQVSAVKPAKIVVRLAKGDTVTVWQDGIRTDYPTTYLDGIADGTVTITYGEVE